MNEYINKRIVIEEKMKMKIEVVSYLWRARRALALHVWKII